MEQVLNVYNEGFINLSKALFSIWNLELQKAYLTVNKYIDPC